MNSPRIITGPQGRRLEVDLSGPEGGDVVVFHHGTPAGGPISPDRTEDGAARGLRHLGYSRPGYGGSDRRQGRSVADCAGDVEAVLDALGIERFYSVGLSGGGPHALACAALLPDRVIAAATIGSIAPYSADGLDWLDGMAEENMVEFEAAQAGASELQAFLERAHQEFAEATGADLHAAFGDLLSEVDRDVVTGEFADFLAETTRAALAPGVWGWFDDDQAFLNDWGFDLASISRLVRIWQGGEDRFVPFAHGEWLASHVAGARPELHPGEGHLSLAVAGYGTVLDGLLADAD